MKKSYDEKVHELVSKHESVLIKCQDAIDRGMSIEDFSRGLDQLIADAEKAKVINCLTVIHH